MKKLIILLLLTTSSVFGQIRIPEENATLAVFLDPTATYKESSPNIGIEFGYQGTIYAKVQLETLPGLTGGYTSLGGAIGGNLAIGERVYIYSGVRLVPWVWRNGASNPLIGFEGGVDYNLGERFYVGIRATYDYREDMKLLNYPVIWRGSGFLKVGYKFNL